MGPVKRLSLEDKVTEHHNKDLYTACDCKGKDELEGVKEAFENVVVFRTDNAAVDQVEQLHKDESVVDDSEVGHLLDCFRSGLMIYRVFNLCHICVVEFEDCLAEEDLKSHHQYHPETNHEDLSPDHTTHNLG